MHRKSPVAGYASLKGLASLPKLADDQPLAVVLPSSCLINSRNRSGTGCLATSSYTARNCRPMNCCISAGSDLAVAFGTSRSAVFSFVALLDSIIVSDCGSPLDVAADTLFWRRTPPALSPVIGVVRRGAPSWHCLQPWVPCLILRGRSQGDGPDRSQTQNAAGCCRFQLREQNLHFAR